MTGHAQAACPLEQEFDMGALLRFALPTMVMMVFMGLYTVVDTVFVLRNEYICICVFYDFVQWESVGAYFFHADFCAFDSLFAYAAAFFS